MQMLAGRELEQLDRRPLVLAEDSGSEWPAEYCARVEIEPVQVDVRLAVAERGMSVNDQSAMIVRGGEERLPDPKQITASLLLERNAWTNTRVDEEALAVVMECGEAFEPRFMVWREVSRRCDAVGTKRRVAAVNEPLVYSVIAVGAAKQFLVVAAKCNDIDGVRCLHIQDGLDDSAAIWASINAVTEENVF